MCAESAMSDAVPGSSAHMEKRHICDKVELDQRMMGDTELRHNVVSVFLQTLPCMLDDIQQALREGDAEKTGEAAHHLKGSAGNLALYEVVETALAMEQAAKNGNISLSLSLLQDLQHHCRSAEQVLLEIIA